MSGRESGQFYEEVENIEEPSIPLHMYDIPGQDPISEHAFERYKKDKEQDSKIYNLAFNPVDAFDEKISNTSEEFRPGLIWEALESGNEELQVAAIDMIMQVPEKDRTQLIQNGFTKSLRVQMMAASAIRNVRGNEQEQLIREAFEMHIEVQRVAAHLIRNLPDSIQSELRHLVVTKIEVGFRDADPSVQKCAAEMIGYAPETEVSRLIQQALSLAGPVQEIAIQKIDYVEDEEDRNALFDIAFTKGPKVRLAATEAITSLPQEKQSEGISRALDDDDLSVQQEAARQIWHIFENSAPLIRKGLTKDPSVAEIAARAIESAPLEDRSTLIHEALQKDLATQAAAIEVITYAPWREKHILIKEVLERRSMPIPENIILSIEDVPDIKQKMILMDLALESDQMNIRIAAAKKITSYFEGENCLDLLRVAFTKDTPVILALIPTLHIAREVELSEYISEILDSPDEAIQVEAATLVYAVEESDQERFLSRIFEKGPKAKIAVLERITYVSESQRARWVREGLASDDEEVQIAAVRAIEHLSGIERAEFVRTALGLSTKVAKQAAEDIWICADEYRAELVRIALSKDASVREVAMTMISSVRVEERDEISRYAMKEWGNEFVAPPLYRRNTVDNESFKREQFKKSGSETTLVGGDLMGKTIVRHIEPAAFLAWQRLYEDYALWQRHGFDYVPVEPIQSFRLNKEGLVDVYSGVLDLSLGEWSVRTELYDAELRIQEDNIRDVLREIQFEHGHPHLKNFCLRFFRDEKGNIDFSRVPRVYLIDFDQAVSPDSVSG